MSLIPFDDRDGTIWMNGAMLPWRDAKVHVLNHGLHYGSSVFEGVRSYGGKIFKLREHTERLEKSAHLMDFSLPYSIEELEEAQKAVIKANNLTDAYLRPFAWRGSEQMAVAANQSKIHVAIAAWQWPAMYRDALKQGGVKLRTGKWARPAPDTAPVAAKAAGLYMIATLSKHEAMEAGYDDALMLDYRGLVAESTGANIFFVMKGAIHTPTPDCFLDGITRRTVMELARKRGYEVIERAIKPEEVTQADEAFLTGTAAEVTPIGKINDKDYQVGQITIQLMDDYAALVRA